MPVRRDQPTNHERHAAQVRTAILIILGAAFASFLLSVALWFGVFGDPDRQAGIFVGLWVPSILGLGAVLAPRGGGGR